MLKVPHMYYNQEIIIIRSLKHVLHKFYSQGGLQSWSSTQFGDFPTWTHNLNLVINWWLESSSGREIKLCLSPTLQMCAPVLRHLNYNLSLMCNRRNLTFYTTMPCISPWQACLILLCHPCEFFLFLSFLLFLFFNIHVQMPFIILWKIAKKKLWVPDI